MIALQTLSPFPSPLLSWTKASGLAVLLLLCAGSQAPLAAQAIAGVQPSTVVPVYQQPRPAYDSAKFTLGSFLLAPSVEQSVSYDDNIFASDRVKASDVIAVTTGELAVSSQWDRHSLNLKAQIAREGYADHTAESASIYGIEGNARLDILKNSFLTFEGGFLQQPQKRDSPQADIASIGRSIYNTLHGGIGYDQAWGPLNNLASVDVTKTAYISQADASRSRTDLQFRDRLTLSTGGLVSPYIQGTYRMRNWLRSGSLRNFDTSTAIAGVVMQVTDIVSVDIGAGVLSQSYRNSNFDTLTTPTFSGDVIWNIRPLTTLTFTADRMVTGIESFCDNSIALFCQTLGGNSIPQLLTVLNSVSGCGDGHCGNVPQFYARELRTFTNAVQSRVLLNQPQPDPAKFLPDVPASLLNQFPGVSTAGVSDPLRAVQFGEQLREALLLFDQGTVLGLKDQRGALEVLSFSAGIQHEFWHDILGEVRFRYEQDKFEPVGLVDNTYRVTANGRWLINRSLELNLTYTYNLRDANQDIQLYNSGPYRENNIALSLKAAL